MSFKRADRVADLVKAELSQILLREVRDEKLSTVAISDVVVSPDLRQARIFFVSLGSRIDPKEMAGSLEKASGFLRRELGKRLDLKYVPSLVFTHDSSFDYGDRIDKLLSEVSE